jgi:hypothetical protein
MFGIWLTVVEAGLAAFGTWNGSPERWLFPLPGLTWVAVGVLAIAIGWLRSRHRRVSLEK